MASETGHTEIPLKENEVLIYQEGKPVFKVERGTPLTVIKMLYNADPKNKGTVIAALRPRTDESLPCLVTLEKSTLTQDKYDIIAFEQPKPTQRIPDYQVGQPIITMGPNGQVHGATVLPAGWPVNTTGLTYAPVNQLLHNHTSGHMPITSVNSAKTTLMHATTPMSYVSPVISNVMSSANLGAIGGQGSFSNIIPRKSPLSLKPVNTPSRRKRSSHKTAYPRKITLVVPDNVTESPGINVKKFLYPKPINRTGRTNSEDAPQLGTDESSSVVVCDSTAGNGHENGRLSSEGTPSPPKEERDRLLHPSNCQQIHESSSPSWEQSGDDGHPIYHNQRSDGSSPEHDSSLEEGDGHAVMIDSDEKESFSAGNDSDTGIIATQSGISSLPENRQLFRNSNTRIQHVEGLDSNGSHYTSRALDEAAPFPRDNYRSDDDNEESDASLQFTTAIVRLENTVRVKAEPLERNSSPCSGAFNNLESNGDATMTKQRATGHSSNSVENESSNFLPTSSVRGIENDGVSGMPPMHPGTPSISTGMPSSLTPYPPNYPRTGDGVAFRCEQCQKEFDTSAALERHRRSHSGERPYKCKICGWGFNLSGNLNQHMAIHQKVKPFKCVYCGKTFARSNVLKAHVRCHTGERPYQCELCGAKFIIPHNLKKHLLNRHQVVWEERRWSSGKAES
ncbi:zinc finger protein 571-like isoform X2 [Actinia tenebrosa]|uniref:Zinc finger protein 571-like isoform X2 n=1 Tax=Actinia tenebrosa TaxID=6105 RepID=A0A6P8IW56_ACTTE|nr:zinc finger protein 571-like isoform X2 [Actinia tenebrosa]